MATDTMLNRSVNKADKLLSKALDANNTGPRESPVAASGNIGAAPTGGVRLAWVEDGVPKRWFKWGRDSFDDPDAVFM